MAKIFFSWQADTPRLTGKNFLHRALESAVDQLNADSDVEDAARPEGSDDPHEVDMDTKGVPGSPPIVDTIFKKIDEAAVFVADLTFVGMRNDGKRPMSNSNVLIEYGWALKSLSHSRVIAVMNSVYGVPTEQSMPFDLRHSRFPITYDCPADADEDTRRKARKQLIAELKDALSDILKLQEQTLRAPAFVPREPVEGRGRFRKTGTIIGRRQNKATDIHLSSSPLTWLRLMPANPLNQELLISKLVATLWDGGPRPEIPNTAGAQKFGVRGPDGFGYYTRGDEEDEALAVMFVFQSGEVWSAETYNLAMGDRIVFLDERAFVDGLTSEAEVLKTLGIPGPYKWIAGMEGLDGRSIGASRGVQPNRFLVDVVEVEGLFSGDPGDAKEALEPFFVRLFDAAGISRP